MLSLENQDEANIGANKTSRAWEAWESAHPEVAEVMMRFLSEVETSDGRRITFSQYTPPKKSRIRLVVRLPADEDDLDQRPSVTTKKKKAAATAASGSKQQKMGKQTTSQARKGHRQSQQERWIDKKEVSDVDSNNDPGWESEEDTSDTQTDIGDDNGVTTPNNAPVDNNPRPDDPQKANTDASVPEATPSNDEKFDAYNITEQEVATLWRDELTFAMNEATPEVKHQILCHARQKSSVLRDTWPNTFAVLVEEIPLMHPRFDAKSPAEIIRDEPAYNPEDDVGGDSDGKSQVEASQELSLSERAV